MDSCFSEKFRTVGATVAVAPLRDDGWFDALRTLASSVGAHKAHLLGIGPTAADFNYIPDIDDAYFGEFATINAHRPEVNWRIGAGGAPFEIIAEEHYAAARQRNPSDAYEDHVRRWGGQAGCQTILLSERRAFVGLAVLKGAGDGVTSSEDRALFGAVAPAVLAAVRMQRAIDNRGSELMAGLFDAIGVAAIVVDGSGTVSAMTKEADRILSSGQLKLTQGRLAAAHHLDAAFQRGISAALRIDLAAPAVTRLWLAGADPAYIGTGWLCEIFRLPNAPHNFGFAPRVLITLRPPSDIDGSRVAVLRQALGLTQAEGEIALALANGTPRETVALARHTSLNTLNAQIKSILGKTAVDREPQVVALVNRLLR